MVVKNRMVYIGHRLDVLLISFDLKWKLFSKLYRLVLKSV